MAARPLFAIALDGTPADLGVQSGTEDYSASYTNSGGDFMTACYWEYSTFGGPFFSGATYDGVAMTDTEVTAVSTDGGKGRLHLLFLANPSTGAHTLYMNNSANPTAMWVGATSYTGVSATGQPDDHAKNTSSSSSSIVTSVTVSAANSWTVLCTRNDSGASDSTAGTGTTQRARYAADKSLAIWDSGGGVSSGSYSMTVNGPTANWGSAMASFAPAGGGTTVPAGIFNNPLRGGGRVGR